MAKVQVLEDFTKEEVIREVFIWTGREISEPTFYRWLPYCLIFQPKKIYTRRDVAKVLFISRFLNRVRDLELACDALRNDLELNPQNYPEV